MSAHPPAPYWSEWLNGVKSGNPASTSAFTVPRGKTLVITDLDLDIICFAATSTLPVFTLRIFDPSGNPAHHVTRFYPTRTTPGHEQQKYSFTSGVVVPSGYKIAFDPNPMPVGTFAVGEGVILGYYVQ